MYFHALPVLYSIHPALGTVTWIFGFDEPPNIRTHSPLVAFLAAACVSAVLIRAPRQLIARLTGWTWRALELTLRLVLAFWYLVYLFWSLLRAFPCGVSAVLSGAVSVGCKIIRSLGPVLDFGLSLLQLAFHHSIKYGSTLVSPRVFRVRLGSSSYVEPSPTAHNSEDHFSTESDISIDTATALPEKDAVPVATCSPQLALASTSSKGACSLVITDPALSPHKTTSGFETLDSPYRSDFEPPQSTAQARDLIWVDRECVDAAIPLDQVRVKEAENRRLRNRIRSLQAEKNKCERERDEAWAQRDQLQIKYDDLFKANDHALLEKDAQIAGLFTKLKASERMSQQCHSVTVRAQEVADASLARAKESEEALAAAIEVLPALRNENNQLRLQIDRLGQEHANLETSLACAEARSQAATRENVDLRKDIYETGEKHTEAQGKIKRLEGLVASANQEAKQKDDAIAARDGKLAKKRRVIAAYKQVLAAKGRSYEQRAEEEKQRHECEVKEMRQKLLGSSARDKLTSAMEMKKLRDELKAMDIACREYLTELDAERTAQVHRKEEEMESLRSAFEKEIAQLKADHQLHIAQLRAGLSVTGSPLVQPDTPINASSSFHRPIHDTSTDFSHGHASFTDIEHTSGSFWIGEDAATDATQSPSGEPSVHPPPILPPSSSENDFSILQCVQSLQVSPSQGSVGSGESHIAALLPPTCFPTDPMPSPPPQPGRAPSPIIRMDSTSCDLLHGQDSFYALSPDTSSCWILPQGAPPFGIIIRDESESDRLSISSLSPQPSFDSEEASLGSFEIPRVEARLLTQLLDASLPPSDADSLFWAADASQEFGEWARTSDCFEEKSEPVTRRPLGRLANAGNTPARPRRPVARV
ncbi:hypothetical protein C8Q79DRAFT_1101736 [Trametes meyenii]|nr:hypothetical protein C8Q79DRAFT_1101736 [Trametes meyenii]